MAKARKEGVVIREKNDIAMNGIETYAVQLYSKYVTNPQDLDVVLSIMKTE